MTRSLNFTIPHFIKRICSWSFCGTSIESITIPSEVRIIEKNAFSDCVLYYAENLFHCLFLVYQEKEELN